MIKSDKKSTLIRWESWASPCNTVGNTGEVGAFLITLKYVENTLRRISLCYMMMVSNEPENEEENARRKARGEENARTEVEA